MEKNWKEHLLEDYSACKGKRVIIRLDWNMPVNEGVITDTSRAEVTFEFLKKLSFAGAKMVLMTHFGEKGESLAPLIPYLQKHLPFVTFTTEQSFEKLEQMSRDVKSGEAMLLENVRMWKGEEENIPSLARSFATLGDMFINNAFSVSHREHASVVGIPKTLLSYMGPLFVRELEHLTLALNPVKPALMIIGGAKIKTKLALIEKYLDKGVRVFVGGAMVHDIWRNKNIEIGQSLHDASISLSETFVNHPLLMTPVDVILSTGVTVPHYDIPKDGIVVDCGEDTVMLIARTIKESKTVIANGPLGLYEKGWLKGTEGVLTVLGESEAKSYIGGGDTVAVAHSLHLLRKFDFVSLGGGAMLDFLANGTLPGIHAVTESKQAGYR
ncbi:MAG: phosphoglycerate kinase [Candidatus Paceibacterota bacterium]